MNEWDEIIADPSFQSQPLDVKKNVASNFFKQNVEADPSFNQQPRETMDSVRANFFKTVDPTYTIESMKGSPVGEETTADRLGKIGLKLFGLKNAPNRAIASGIHGSAASIYAGAEAMVKYGQLLGKQLSEVTGLPEGGAIAEPLVKFLEGQRKAATERAAKSMPEDAGVTEKVIAGLASAPGGVAEFGMHVPYAMIKGYMNNGLKGMVEEGASRAIWGWGMGFAHGVTPARAAATMGVAAGAESLARGEGIQDTAANTLTMMILGWSSGNKQLSRANKIRVAQAEDAAMKGDFKSLADTLGEINKSQPDIVKEATIQAKNRVDELGKVTPDEIQKEVQRGLGVKKEDVADSYLALKKMGEEKKPAEAGRKEEPVVSSIEKIEEPPVGEEAIVAPEEEIAPIAKAEEVKAAPIEEAKAPEAITKEAVSMKIKELEDLGKVEEADVLREAFDIAKEEPLGEEGLGKEEVAKPPVEALVEGGVSIEEIARPGVNYEVDALGKTPAFLGKKVDVGKDKASIGLTKEGDIVVRTNNTNLSDQQLVDMYGDKIKSMAAKVEEKPLEAIEIPEGEVPSGKVDLAKLAKEATVTTVQRMDISKPETIVNPIVDLINKRNEADKAGDVEQVKSIQEQARIAKSVFWAKAAKDEAAGRVTREQTMQAWDEIIKAEDASMTPKQRVNKDVVDVLEGNEREDIDKIMTPEEYKAEVIDKIPEPTAAELKIQEAELQKEIKLSNMKAIRLAAIRKAQKEGKQVSISPLKEEIERAPKEKDVKAQSDELTRLLMESGDIDGVIEERPGQYRRKGPKELRPEEDLHFGISEENYRLAKDYFTKGTKERLFGGGPDLEYVTHLTNIAGYHLARGMQKFEDFAKLVVKEVGEHARPYMLKAWQAAQTQYKLQTEVYNSKYRIADPDTAVKFRNDAPIADQADLATVKSTVNDMPNRWFYLGNWLTTPERAFDYIDEANPAAKWKDTLLRPYRHAEKEKLDGLKIVDSQVDAVKKSGIPDLSKRLAIASYAEQPGGKRIMEEFMGIKEIPNLSANERQVLDKFKSQYEWAWGEINKMRTAIGVEPIGYIENYSPFAMSRAIELLEKNGMDPVTATKKALENAFQEASFDFTHPRMTKFQYENRKMAMQNLSLDFFGTYKKYMDTALRHIYLSPIAAKANAMISDWTPSPADKALTKMGMKENALIDEPFKLADNAKNWSDYLQEWSDHITGKPPVEKWPKAMQDLMFRLRNNVVAYTLMFSNRTTLVQFAAMAQAWPQVGSRSMLKGMQEVASTFREGRNKRYEKSDVLAVRRGHYETALDDFIDAVKHNPNLVEQYAPFEWMRKAGTKYRVGTPGKVHGAVKGAYMKAGSALMTITDAITADIVWEGAYSKAKNVLNLNEASAVKYADDMVIKTQGSAAKGEITPLQRRQWGKTISVFQTYNINQWGNIVEDIMGMSRPDMDKRTAVSNTLRFMISMAVANVIYEDILGMQSPFPTVFRRIAASLKAGDSAPAAALKGAREVTELVPFATSTTKYGSHPLGAVAELLGSTSAVIGGRKGPQPSGLELAGKWVGFPGGGQIAKSVRQYEKNPEADLYDILMGNYTGARDTMLEEILFSEGGGSPKPLKGVEGLKGVKGR